MHTVIQALGALLLLGGVFLLAGVGWALVLGGAGLLTASVLTEMYSPARRRRDEQGS